MQRINDFGARRAYIAGVTTIQAFLKADLVDEITVIVAPVLIGQGISLFGALEQVIEPLVKGSYLTAQGGMVASTYEVVRNSVVQPTSS